MTGPAAQGPTEHDPADTEKEGPWDDVEGPLPEHVEHELAHHGGHDPHGHLVDADHHHHGDEDLPSEDPFWVIPPILVGVVLGIVLLVVFGIASDASPFHSL